MSYKIDIYASAADLGIADRIIKSLANVNDIIEAPCGGIAISFIDSPTVVILPKDKYCFVVIEEAEAVIESKPASI